jgi:hypothetical protein
LPKKSIENTIKEYNKLEKQSAENIFNQLFLYICSLESKEYASDLYILAKLLKPEDIKKIVDYFGGDFIRVPRKEEYRASSLIALCFFLKVIKGYDWADIKDFIKLSDNNADILSTISIGRKINNIQNQIGKDILTALQGLEIENIDKLFSYFSDIRGYIHE